MSNIKKIIGVLLALVMAFSVITVAFAAEGDEYSITVSSDKATLAAGESATVTVSVQANFNVCAMSIPVFFDNTKVTASEGTVLLSGVGDKANIATETSTDVDKLFEGSGHTKDDYGVRALIYIAKQGDALNKYENETAVMSFTVTAKDDATGAVVLECIETAVKTSSNPSGTIYLSKNQSGNAKLDSLPEVIDNANVTGATTTINIAAVGGDPVLTGINGGVVGDATTSIDMTGYVYGIPTKTTDITEYFAVENGTITVSGTGTGATLQVYDNAGVAYGDPYTVIIFGDVDGSNTITSDDYIAVKAATTTTPLSGAFAIAADVDCNGSVASDDYISVKAATTTTPLSQNPFN